MTDRGPASPSPRSANGSPPSQDEARFDAELRVAARGLVHEELPRDILDPGYAVQPGDARPRLLPGLATSGALVAVVLIVAALAFGPGSPFGPGPSPTVPAATSTAIPAAPFRATTQVVSHLVAQGYSCNDGFPLATSGPKAGPAVRESAVCSAPKEVGPMIAAIILGESARSRVVAVWMKADIMGEDTPSNRDAVALLFSNFAAMSFVDSTAGREAGNVIITKLPRLEPGTQALAEVGGTRITVMRHENGSFGVAMEQLAPA